MEWRRDVQAEFARLGKQADWSVVEELAQHAAAAYEAARADGMSAAEAETSVLALIRAWCNETTGPHRIERPPLVEAASASRSRFAGLGLDLRHAIRLIRRQPSYAVVSIVMIALGIAAATSLVSVVNGVLLRPLPWPTGDRLVRVYETRQAPLILDAKYALTNVTYRVWNEAPQTIDGVGAWLSTTMLVPSDAGLERVPTTIVTATLFPLLGASPLMGRSFTAADETSNDTVVLSYGFWRERFGAQDAIGKQITTGGRPRTVIGVMPPDFEFPTRETRLWTPYLIEPFFEQRGGRLTSIDIYIFSALARLKPGVTPAQAAAEASARLNTMLPAEIREEMIADAGSPGPLRVTATPMLDWMVNDIKPALWILLAAGTLLFAAAIGTVVNVQLVQATARRREVAIRSAIGAGSGRVARQLFVETTVIAAIGGTLGVALTVGILGALPWLLPEDFPRATHVALDQRVLALATGLTLVVAIAIGLLPSVIARKLRLTSALAEDGSAPIGQGLRTSAARSRALIITSQVAIAAVLLVGAAFLSQSFIRMLRVDRGYVPDNLITARVGFQGVGLPAGARAAFFSDLVDRAAAMPGALHAGLTNSLPLTPGDPRAIFSYDQGAKSFGKNVPADVNALSHTVSPGYLASMGIRVVKGRDFTRQDTSTSELVMLVNETYVRRHLANDPLDVRVNATLDEQRPDANPWRIVGVVADVRHRSAAEPPEPEVYAPVAQMSNAYLGPQFLTVRTARDPTAATGELRTLIRAISPNAVVDQVMTMDARITTSLARPRLYAVLLGGFASFALLIAGVGLFGGLSYGVSQRTREIGVRTALGATPLDIVRLVLKQGGVMVTSGLVVGFGVAAGTSRFLAGFLFGVTESDPATYAIVGLVLAVVAGVACTIPARRAARIDAITALRR